MDVVAISKFLSYVLRHEPEAIGLTLDAEGWADIAALLEAAARHGRPLERETLRHVVETSDKKRFTISEDGLRIRAAQGHSAKGVSMSYPEGAPPERLYHGTASRFLSSILAEGLVPQERHHVHLSGDERTAIAVGQRHGKPVVLAIAAGEMHRQGYKFYCSENGVWLTDSVPPTFIQAPQA
ncbi:MAG TPA: RNA 2'-phosphotransferase [Oscillatoriaceae cyanobacterium]